MRIAVLVLAGLMAATILPTHGRAQSSPAAAPAAVETGPIVAEVRRLIREHYIRTEHHAALDALLARGLAEGRYADPATLADRVTQDLMSVSNDGHLGLVFDPEQAARVGTRQGDELREGPVWERWAQLRNHGVTTMRIYPGNVRYVAYDNFTWVGRQSAEALDVLAAFLAQGDAAIIDVSQNMGGSPLAVQYLISHFLEPGRPLVEFHMGGRTEPDRRASLQDIPNRMVGKPLFVVVGSHTASAAEEFAGHVRGFGLGEIVGGRTYGAAYRNDLFAIGGKYVLSVSVGRPVLASTGDDWEGEGIAPTLPASEEQARDVARYHALRRLQGMAPQTEREELQLAADLLGARLYPAQPALPLAAYAGTYGERTISVVNGVLRYQRTGGLTSNLLPVEPNVFLLESAPATWVAFTVSGAAVQAFDLVQLDGSRTTVARTAP